MNILRIAVLMHEDLRPPDKLPADHDWDTCEWVTEWDVVTTLRKMGHDVQTLGVFDELKPIREMNNSFKPHVVFNLLEEFDEKAFYDQNIVSYLELIRAPYTGCNPRGLMIGREKALSKKILSYHKIKTPKFHVFPKNQKVKVPKNIEYPLIVKCLNEEASLGISKASIVHNDDKLLERIEFLHGQLGKDAIAEAFIEGQEIYVGVLGNYRLESLPPWALYFDKANNPDKEIYSNNAKFNWGYRENKGIRSAKADISPQLEKEISDVAKRAYRALSLNGYARMDFRVDKDGGIYLLEANPNPNIGELEEFADSALFAGTKYPDLLQKILTLGVSWSSRNARD
jgi:D-alanine-D-alanine ligase